MTARDREETLKPCPFCGGAAILHDRMSAPEAWVRCRACHASAEAHGDEAAAIADWNRRNGLALARAEGAAAVTRNRRA